MEIHEDAILAGKEYYENHKNRFLQRLHAVEDQNENSNQTATLQLDVDEEGLNDASDKEEEQQ